MFATLFVLQKSNFKSNHRGLRSPLKFTTMWSVYTKNGGLVAKDFRTKPEALAWIKFYGTPGMQVKKQ